MPAKMWRLHQVMLRHWGCCVERMPRTATLPTGLNTCSVKIMGKLLSALFLSSQVKKRSRKNKNWLWIFCRGLYAIVSMLTHQMAAQWWVSTFRLSKQYNLSWILPFFFFFLKVVVVFYSTYYCRCLKLIERWTDLEKLGSLYSLEI